MRDLALPELLEGESVTVIEWGDQIVPALPQDYLEIRLEYGSKENERDITISLVGTSWKERMAQITKIMDRWSVR